MSRTLSSSTCMLLAVLGFVLLVKPAAAFGAGNIASVSSLEGHNWRHGDIEDILKTVAFIHGKKWTSAMVKRVYFGNWLRDYSQAMDVGTLKGMQADTIRILLWVLSFVTFGYATEEFEVTMDRLGVYRPEEHIDNPKGYADDKDARQFDPRLRPPIQQIELDIDTRTGMKNYIANEDLSIATSSGYVKFSLARSIHYGRLYTNGSGGTRGKEADLCEALRCMGQALHTLEDFSAHSNYIELALREQGHSSVFAHVGTATEIDLHGHRVFPLVTGTFGMVDFLHSVLGEATDHLSQSEVSEVDALNRSLAMAEEGNASGGGSRGFDDDNSGGNAASNLIGLLGQLPGTGDLSRDVAELQQASDHQANMNRATNVNTTFAGPPGSQGGPPSDVIPGTNINPQETLRKIYPILQFRDKVVRSISAIVEKIPGLEALMEKITDTLTLFIMSLLAPFVRPVINAVTKQLKSGAGGMVDASGKHQFEPWTDPHCTDPTHSLLSKDHFANILNELAGQVAAVTVQYVAPRIIYAWEHPDISVDQVMTDVLRTFHHPAIRDRNCEIHNQMYATVENWARKTSGVDHRLSSDSVRTGKNLNEASHAGGGGHSHGSVNIQLPGGFSIPGIPNVQQIENTFAGSFSQQFGGVLNPFKKFSGGGFTRDGDDLESEIQPGAYDQEHQYQSALAEQFSGGRQYGGESYDAPSGPPAPHQQQFGYGPEGGFHENFQGSYGQYQAQEPAPWEHQSGYGNQPVQSYQQSGPGFYSGGQRQGGDGFYQETRYEERRW